MAKDAKISLYVTPERKRELERRADDADMGVSPYIDRLIERQLRMDAENEISAETRAAENLQRIIDEGVRDIRDATGDLREMTAKSGAYSIANFEFLKQDRGEPEINDALSTGARRLRDSDDSANQNDKTTGEWGYSE